MPMSKFIRISAWNIADPDADVKIHADTYPRMQNSDTYTSNVCITNFAKKKCNSEMQSSLISEKNKFVLTKMHSFRRGDHSCHTDLTNSSLVEFFVAQKRVDAKGDGVVIKINFKPLQQVSQVYCPSAERNQKFLQIATSQRGTIKYKAATSYKKTKY